MNFLRKHWYDLGGFFALLTLLYLLAGPANLSSYQRLMWASLVSLFCHQLEEYRIAGTFPGMINAVLYKSTLPDRYPLNTNTACYINVLIGWSVYLLAAIFAEQAIWLGMAAIMVSLGNVVAHTILFNIRGKTWYNAGLVTCWLLFVPCILMFVFIIHRDHLATWTDMLVGILLGVLINIIGILKMIGWMADKNTTYIFEDRNLLPADRRRTTGSKAT